MKYDQFIVSSKAHTSRPFQLPYVTRLNKLWYNVRERDRYASSSHRPCLLGNYVVFGDQVRMDYEWVFCLLAVH